MPKFVERMLFLIHLFFYKMSNISGIFIYKYKQNTIKRGKTFADSYCIDAITGSETND